MFPFGTTPAINWSANPGDCADPGRRVRRPSSPAPTIRATSRTAGWYGSYSHNGIFDATLRIHRLSGFPNNTGEIFKEYPLAMEAINQYPEPRFTVSRPDPNVRNFLFTNAGGGDDGQFPLTYAWDFGDGKGDSGEEDKTHLYAAVGVHTATLTVTDGDGLSGSFALPVKVTNALPVPRITVNCQLSNAIWAASPRPTTAPTSPCTSGTSATARPAPAPASSITTPPAAAST